MVHILGFKVLLEIRILGISGHCRFQKLKSFLLMTPS